MHFILGDFREDDALKQLETILAGRKADLVLSDMAPNLSGIALADAARMEDLIDLAIEFCQAHMKTVWCITGQVLQRQWLQPDRGKIS